MIDHVSIKVQDYARAKAFYEKALAPLGYALQMEFPEQGPPSIGGFGPKGKPCFWVSAGERVAPVHVAFVGDRGMVDAFHAAAIAAGGVDNGGPGVRELYHPSYYAAFVLDPDGNNVEVVCQTPDGKLPGAAKAKSPAKTKGTRAKKAAVKAKGGSSRGKVRSKVKLGKKGRP